MIKLGISSCLLGQKVRYDGQHKKDDFIIDHFGKYIEWVPICPEVEIGLGVPRETIHLQSDTVDQSPRLISTKTNKDLTDKMLHFADKKSQEFPDLGIVGYIFKKSSPSCGIFSVKIYDQEKKLISRKGQGKFVEKVIQELPYMPIEDESRLRQFKFLESFVIRIFAYHRWFYQLPHPKTKSALIQFHEHYKYHLMARNQARLKRLGQLLGSFPSGRSPHAIQKIAQQYFQEFFQLMVKNPSLKGQTNVLFHLFGYFSQEIDSFDRQELKDLIKDYQKGLVPIIAPLTLIRHYVRKKNISYLLNQAYLFPHPVEERLLYDHL